MVKTKLCERDWLVRPALWADLRMVRAKVDQYLAAIEFVGIDRFWAPTDLHPSVDRIYQNLGVVSGSVFSHWKEPGQIGIMFPTRGGAFKRAATAIEAADKEAFKVDNRRKLGLSCTNERHLVVYVYPTHYSPWCALVDCNPPAEPAKLPPEITDLWLLSETRSAHELTVWRGTTSLPWHSRMLSL